jgi:serine/threonine protein kinase
MQQSIGKYHVQWEIAESPGSTVYFGEDPFSGQKVAIKVVRQKTLHDAAGEASFKKQFLTEASMASALKHPHIVKVLDAGAEGTLKYMVMEYVPGKTLATHCRPDRLLSEDKVVEIIFKCCNALDYAARQGVIHRNLKPANLLLGENTDVKVSDFGTALMESTEVASGMSAPQSPAYMPPEQIQGKQLTLQSDIYSLGAVMFHLLCGRLPYEASSPLVMTQQIVQAPIPSLTEINPDISPELARIVERCIQKTPAARYHSWGELQAELSSISSMLEPRSDDVTDTRKFNLLKKLSFFQDFSDEALWEVQRIARWGRFSGEKTLIEEGKLGSSIYIIASGNARIIKNGVFLGTIEEGQCFGEMSYIRGQQTPRTATVISDREVIVIKINAENLKQTSERVRNLFNMVLLNVLANRLERTSIMASMI